MPSGHPLPYYRPAHPPDQSCSVVKSASAATNSLLYTHFPRSSSPASTSPGYSLASCGASPPCVPSLPNCWPDLRYKASILHSEAMLQTVFPESSQFPRGRRLPQTLAPCTCAASPGCSRLHDSARPIRYPPPLPPAPLAETRFLPL